MSESRAINAFQGNPTASDLKSPSGRIPGAESDGLPDRIKDVLDSESVSAFSRRCGVGESTLRNILNGALPRTDYLVAIADAGGVTIDWLATGRLPKTRAEWQAQRMPRPADASAYDGRRDVLEAVLRVAEHKIRNNLVDKNVIEAGLSGAPSWMDSARDYPDLEPRLRSMIATLEFIKAAGVE